MTDTRTNCAPTALTHFINGEHWTGTSSEVHQVRNPATGQQIAQAPCGTTADVDRAVAAAKAAFPQWSRRTPAERSELLLQAAEVVTTHAEDLAQLESVNAGKPMPLAREDVAGTIDTLRFMAGAARSQPGVSAGEYVAGRTSMLVREPVGVVAGIIPWNYPLMTAAWKIGPILAVGDTCVLKPSEQTPLTVLRLAELLDPVLPSGVLNVVTGRGSVVGEALATHPDVALVSVTGSVGSGKAVAHAAADSLKRVHLELGGKAPVVVFADADLEAVADGVVFAGFGNTGQDCGAACRILVEESVHDELVALLTARAEALVVGDPAEGEHIEMGPLVTEEHRDRVTGFLERAYAEGVRATTGGQAAGGAGFFMPPTVLVDIPGGAECVREEIFGPVVTVEKFTGEDAAIDAANDVPYGLSASVWTTSARRSADVPARLDFGTVWINDHLAFATEMPWGGFKASGYGRDLSAYALEDYSRTKHIMLNRTR
ncbi:aminobutyraldehyde dehydrogenase [Sciscionella marina]|uniref:aminobutyraldehyde dehydrogenase n=1 Tax=Sciscionella marina TaxID=508770 RepID=UPI0003A4997C|nr:aminobutyraldehyde dehydrogenase [Sciscionella marina]